MQVKEILFYGDSKTANYDVALATFSAVARTSNVLPRSTPAKIAVGGRMWSTSADNIDAELAAATGTPDYICINLGANDVGASTFLDAGFDTALKTDAAYVLDAMHAKYASALVIIMKPGRQSYDDKCTILNGWIAEVISTRAWATFGPDEQVFLKGADNYVSNTEDGVHPNAAGLKLTGDAWASVLNLTGDA